MRFSIKYILLALLIPIISLEAGSYFTSQIHSMGLRVYNPGVRGMGMGNTGIALMDSVQLGNYNISQWRHITDTRLTIGIRYNRINTQLNNEDFLASSAGFAGISLAIPIKRNKWVIGLNFQPYALLDFKSSQSQVSNGISFTQNNIINGAIGKAQLNLVWSPVSTVGISINGNYYFGSIEDRYEYTFDDGSYRDISQGIKYKISGPGLGFSADIQPKSWLTIAGFADTRSALKVQTSYTSSAIYPDSIQRNLEAFPLHFGLGSAIMLSSRWNLAIDYSHQFWSETLKEPTSDYEDWYLLAIGVEREASRKRKPGFFNLMDIRGGFSTKKIGYKFNNESVLEHSAHFGLGFPFNQYRNRIDIGISAGLRGDKTKNLAEEKFINFSASIAIGERWFRSSR